MKNALITGATKGIGRAIAIALAKQGINLAICSRNLKELQETKTYLESLHQGVKVYMLQTDVSDKEQLLNFAWSAKESFTAIHIIVNNAGTYLPSSILKDTDNNFNNLISANLQPAYELYRFFGSRAKEIDLEHIFNICSVAALNPVTEAGTYTVTKAALLSLSNVMRLEMRPLGIKVTAIIPGSTLTSSWGGVSADKNKFVLPEDIAAAVITIYKMSPGANVDEMIIAPVSGQQ